LEEIVKSIEGYVWDVRIEPGDLEIGKGAEAPAPKLPAATPGAGLALPAATPDAYSAGLAALESGNYDRAIAAFSKAIEADSKDVFPYMKRALAHEKKGNRGAAVDDYKKALTVTRDDHLRREISAAIKRAAKQ
jgi:Flp pilus assembly protein TadD